MTLVTMRYLGAHGVSALRVEARGKTRGGGGRVLVRLVDFFLFGVGGGGGSAGRSGL